MLVRRSIVIALHMSIFVPCNNCGCPGGKHVLQSDRAEIGRRQHGVSGPIELFQSRIPSESESLSLERSNAGVGQLTDEPRAHTPHSSALRVRNGP